MSFRILFVASIVLSSVYTAQAEVTNISVIINAAQETPSPTGVSDSAAGFASLQLDDVSNELNWDIGWQDLSGPPTGMHIHAPAGLGTNAGVVVNLGAVGGLSSPSVGSTTITDEVADFLRAGEAYINIHTELNGPGEIRGQVDPTNVNLFATLDTIQEIPAPAGVPNDAGGSARIAYDADTNTLGWHIQWDNLTGPATGMHFHGPAGSGETAGVQVNVGGISGLTSPSIGSTVISDEFAEQLLDGRWYLNIHTAANGPGEIRGQIVPEPTGAMLVVLSMMAIGQRRFRRCSRG